MDNPQAFFAPRIYVYTEQTYLIDREIMRLYPLIAVHEISVETDSFIVESGWRQFQSTPQPVVQRKRTELLAWTQHAVGEDELKRTL